MKTLSLPATISLYDLDEGGFFFLSHPYTHPDRAAMRYRMIWMDQYAAALINAGLSVYSPVSHNLNGIDDWIEGENVQEFELYREQNYGFLMQCDAVIVCRLPGWTSSPGVRDEVRFILEQCPDTPIFSTDTYAMGKTPTEVEASNDDITEWALRGKASD